MLLLVRFEAEILLMAMYPTVAVVDGTLQTYSFWTNVRTGNYHAKQPIINRFIQMDSHQSLTNTDSATQGILYPTIPCVANVIFHSVQYDVRRNSF